MSFVANHETKLDQASVKISFADDFGLHKSSLEVRAISGFVQTAPDVHLIDSQTIEI